MWISRLAILFILTGPFLAAQLPSIAERALKRQKAKEENDARHAAAVEKQKAALEARQKAAGERKEAAAARDASRASKPDPNAEQGVTGPLHEKYMKRVVFLTADRGAEAVQEGDLTSEFTLGQPVYFRVYMAQTAPRALAKVVPDATLDDLAFGMFYRFRISVDGKAAMELPLESFSSKRNNLQWTSWRGFFVKGADVELSTDQGGGAFREFLARASQKGLLGAGKHVLHMEVEPFYVGPGKVRTVGEVVAAGDVTMTVPAGVFAASNPDLCISTKVSHKDPALEGQILKSAVSVWQDKENRPVFVQMATPSWRIERHPASGLILHRSIDAVVATRGPEFCQYRGYHYQQVFEGNAYAPGKLLLAERNSTYLPCACLGK